MKSMLLGAAAALALTASAYAQDSNNANTTAPSPNPSVNSSSTMNNSSASAGEGQFITKQDAGIVRAPKLVGVSVYDKDNKNVGKIADILLDKSGKVEAVVIGIGGFLGIGTKDIALPYDAVKWQTEQRTVATNGAAPGAAPNAGMTTTNTGGTVNSATGATTNGGATGANNAAAPAQKTVAPAQQEAYNGYPDRAVVDMSQQQLKDAPEFKYASQVANSAADVGTNGNSTAK